MDQKYMLAIQELKTFKKTGGQLMLLKPGFFNRITDTNVIYGKKMSLALERLRMAVDFPVQYGKYFSSINEYIMARKNGDFDPLLDDPNDPKEDDQEPSIDELLDQELPASKKTSTTVEKISTPRANSGTMVSFIRSKDGRRITAPGVEYFVVRHEGKLHYKEASQVIILPDGWQEGDPIEGI